MIIFVRQESGISFQLSFYKSRVFWDALDTIYWFFQIKALLLFTELVEFGFKDSH